MNMTAINLCFKNDADVQLMIQIAGAFDTLLNSAYTWVTEIEESTSPVKNYEKKDVVCIPKTPSQIRAKRTRVAKRRKSSCLPSTAVKTSVHKRTTRTTKTLNQEREEPTGSAKTEEGWNVKAGLHNEAHSKTNNPSSSGVDTKKSSGVSGQSICIEGAVDLPFKKTSSRLRKNLLAEFDNLLDASLIKRSKSRDGKAKQKQHSEEENCFAIEETTEINVDAQQNVNTNEIKWATPQKDRIQGKEFVEAPVEDEIPSTESLKVEALKPLMEPETVLDDKPSPSKVTLSKEDIDNPLHDSVSSNEIQAQLMADLKAAEEELSVWKSREIASHEKCAEKVNHLEAVQSDKNDFINERILKEDDGQLEEKGIAEVKQAVPNVSKEISVSSAEVAESNIQTEIFPKKNFTGEVKRKSNKSNNQAKRREHSQSRGKKFKTAQNSNALYEGQSPHVGLPFVQTSSSSSSDIVQLKLQHKELEKKLQKMFSFESAAISAMPRRDTFRKFTKSRENCESSEVANVGLTPQASSDIFVAKDIEVAPSELQTTVLKNVTQEEIVTASSRSSASLNTGLEVETVFEEIRDVTLACKNERNMATNGEGRVDDLHTVEDRNSGSLKYGEVECKNSVDHEMDPFCRDSGFASIYSRDTRHSVKSNCFIVQPLREEEHNPALDDLVPSYPEENACMDSEKSTELFDMIMYHHHQHLPDVSVSPHNLGEFVPSIANGDGRMNVGGESKLLGLETITLPSFINPGFLDQSLSSNNIYGEDISQKGSAELEQHDFGEHLERTSGCSERGSSTADPEKILSFKSFSPLKNKDISVVSKFQASISRTSFSKASVKDRGRLFSPLTSSPSFLFSTTSTTSTVPISRPLTTFTANYSPKVLLPRSPKHEAENGSKFSNTLFSTNAPTKSYKSPVKLNPANFSERVFCKSSLKPVFSSNLKTPLKCSLFESGSKGVHLNVAVVKTSFNPATLPAAKKLDDGGDVAEDDENSASVGSTASFEERDANVESTDGNAKGSPVKSLFSNIKDSCKKIWSFKRSPSPHSKFDDKNKISFFPVSPKTPDVLLDVDNRDGFESEVKRENKLLEIISCDSQVSLKSPDLAPPCTPIRSQTIRRTPSVTTSKVTSMKSVDKNHEKNDTLASIKKSKKKSTTLKVGLPWRKKKRKSSGHYSRKISSEFKKFELLQKQALNLDDEFDDIAKTYKTNGGDSLDIDTICNENTSVVAPKNLNTTYLVTSGNHTFSSAKYLLQGKSTGISSIHLPSSAKADNTFLLSGPTQPSSIPSEEFIPTPNAEERRSSNKRHSIDAGLHEGRTSALKYMRVSGQYKDSKPINEGCEIVRPDITEEKQFLTSLVAHNIEEESAAGCNDLRMEPNTKAAEQATKKSPKRIVTCQTEVPHLPSKSDNHLIEGSCSNLRMPRENLQVASPSKTVSRTTILKDKFKQFFQSGSTDRKVALTSTPSTVSLPQRVATQFADSKSHRRVSKGSTTKKSKFCSSLFKNRTTTKVHKRTGYESETSDGSAACSTDSKSITSKKMISNKYPANYFSAKNQTPSVGKAISSEELFKQKFVDKKNRLEEADKRKADHKLKKAEEARRKREEKQMLVEQRKKEQEEKARQQAAAMNQKMDEKLRMTQKILHEKEKEEKEKQRLREKRMFEAEQRRKQEEELKAQVLLQQEREREKQEEAFRRQKELEAQEKNQKMAEIRKIEETKRMEAEREKKMLQEKLRQDQERLKLEKEAKDKFKMDMKSDMERKRDELNKRLAEEKKKREIEKKLDEHNKRVLNNHLKKGHSASDLSKRMMALLSPDNYDISNIKFGDCTDDEDNPRKRVPKWATEPWLSEAVLGQHLNPPDLDTIFDLQFSIDLCEAFSRQKPRFFKRTSSAHWDTAPVTHNINLQTVEEK